MSDWEERSTRKEEELPTEESSNEQTLKLKELEESLAAKTQEAETNYQRLLRLGADFENYKKRIEREQSEFLKSAQAQLIKDLLPVLDNLERALGTVEAPPDTNKDALISGLEMVFKQFKEVLAKAGVEEIKAKGEPFDPSLHEAVEVRHLETQPEGIVVDEFQKGYLLHGKVLRPAKVVVAKNPTV